MMSKILLSIIVFPSFLFCQLSSKSIEKFFQKQQYQIYFWEHENKPPFFIDDTLSESFLPIMVKSNQKDSTKIENYINLKSQIIINNYEERYPVLDTTYFYYIPLSNSINSKVQFFNSEKSEIKYKKINAPYCSSKKQVNSVLSSILLLESDLKKYNVLRSFNANFKGQILYISIAIVGYAFLGYDGYKHRHSEGSKGTWNLIGGITVASLSAALFVKTTIDFVKYLINNSEISDITERIHKLDY